MIETSLPPGPRTPGTVQMLAWALRPNGLMARAARRYGDVFTVRLTSLGTYVFVADPAEIKRIFTEDPAVLRAGTANQPLEPVVGPQSLLLLDGASHLRQRRLLLPPFRGQRLAIWKETMREVTAESVARWPTGTPFQLQPEMQALTLEIILRVVFGLEGRERVEHVRRALLEMLDAATHPGALLPWLRHDVGPLTPWRAFLEARDHVDEVLFEEIAHRREDPNLEDRADVLSMLLGARDEDGQPMTDRELRDELITLLVAGHETTATSLAWAFERLLRQPEALERLTEEARADDGDAYAEAVVRETLRLRPVLPVVVRHVTEPWQLREWTLPEGVRVAPCIWLTHRREDLYPDANAFRPERFLDKAPETYGWLPFGGGTRRCVGAAFAELEMRIALHEILRTVELRADDPTLERTSRRAIVLAPRRGGAVIAARRSAQRKREPVAVAA